MRAVAKRLGGSLDFVKMPPKDPFDFAVIEPKTSDIMGYVEVKRRSHAHGRYRQYMITQSKYFRARDVLAYTGRPTFLLVSFVDAILITCLSDLRPAQFSLRMGGRTDRDDPNDLDPCIFFDISLFQLVELPTYNGGMDVIESN